jgi:hypothetical protein
LLGSDVTKTSVSTNGAEDALRLNVFEDLCRVAFVFGVGALDGVESFDNDLIIESPRKTTTSASKHLPSVILFVCITSLTHLPRRLSRAAARIPRFASNTVLKSSVHVDVPSGLVHLCKLYRHTVNESSPKSLLDSLEPTTLG